MKNEFIYSINKNSSPTFLMTLLGEIKKQLEVNKTKTVTITVSIK